MGGQVTLEVRDEFYSDFETKLTWLVKRMRRFYEEARTKAIDADKAWDDYVNRKRGAKDLYDKLVFQQAMYDRWAMREAAIIQAEIAVQEHRKSQSSDDYPHIQPLPQRIPHEGFSVGKRVR